ncbi:hypothetical protein HMI54_010817 [Coelomomyces lativittatus]|nr:hypothetical protein HMI56_007426 [Coelomomyces lativittatus]KAJ1516104.1 hypothetical protein HMI54_010817 [Coelomomyces lativittatus]
MSKTAPTSTYPWYHQILSRFSNGKTPGDAGYYKEIAIIFTVFGITGTSSLKLVRYTLNAVIGPGSLIDGPNTWRLAYLFCGLPMYSALLLTLGTLSGRGTYFRAMLIKMHSRFLPNAYKKYVSVSVKKTT